MRKSCVSYPTNVGHADFIGLPTFTCIITCFICREKSNNKKGRRYDEKDYCTIFV
jgi:hypothetical protein